MMFIFNSDTFIETVNLNGSDPIQFLDCYSINNNIPRQSLSLKSPVEPIESSHIRVLADRVEEITSVESIEIFNVGVTEDLPDLTEEERMNFLINADLVARGEDMTQPQSFRTIERKYYIESIVRTVKLAVV